MIWLICALLSYAALGLCLGTLLSKRKNSLQVIVILGCLFAATYIAYIPAYLASYDTLGGIVGNFVHVLRVMTIDADFMEFYLEVCQGCGFAVLRCAYVLLLGVLHVSLPAVSALTAVTVLFRCYSSLQMFFANLRAKPIFVFSEVNARSLQLARSLEGLRCDIVFAGSSKDSLSQEAEGGRSYILKEEPISELKLIPGKNKEMHLFCISEDEDLSLSHTLQLIERFSQSSEEEQEHIHIYQFTKQEDFSVFIDSADKESLDIQCINEYEILSYDLLDKYPLYQYADKKIHVLLYGLAPINMTMLKAVSWCGQLGGYDLQISVVGKGIAQAVDKLRITNPGLFSHRYCVDFYDCASDKQCIDTIAEKCKDANYIVVAENTDNDTMNQGLLLRRLFYKLDPDFRNSPPIFCYVREPAKYSIVEKLTTAESNPKRKMSYSLIPFGSLTSVYTYKKLVDADLEKLAKNVHLAYEEIFSDGPIDVKDALRRYNIFEVNKRSNRANALHIRYKLNLLGLDYTEDPKAEAVDMKAQFDEEKLMQLSISEHDRWMAFLEAEGWVPSTREEVIAYRESGISKGRHNCPLLKMHPYICEYEKLKDLSMELEGKDTAIYDTELILRIPDILGDKWGAAGKQFKITKR